MADETVYGELPIDGLTFEELAKHVADVVVGHNHDGINSKLVSVEGNPGIAGTGSATTIPRFTGGSSIGDSIMEELNNDTIHIAGDFDTDGSGSFGETLDVGSNLVVGGTISGDGGGITNLPPQTSASHAVQADNAKTADSAISAISASHTLQADSAISAISASHAVTASFVVGIASFRTGSYTGTFIGSASHAAEADTAVLAVSAVTALTASLADVAASGTGSFTSSFRGAFEGQIPSESRVYHVLADDGIFSSSFTMSWGNNNFRKMTVGANINVSFTGLSPGQACLLEVDNIGDHIVIFTDPEVIWSEGVVPSTPTGSSLLSVVEMTVGTVLSFPIKDAQ